ncbi:MAG: cation:proton antiporter [Gemmatimonadales bacterium]
MSPVALFLVTIAAIFMIGTLGEVVFKRTQVPDVLWLLVVGIVLGPVAGVVSRAQLGEIAPFFGALTLVVVLFDGGSRLQLREISRAAPRSGLLAVSAFLIATLVIAVAGLGAQGIGLLPAAWTWSHMLLLGAILGGSSSIIIMPAMNLAKVRPAVANLVNLESAFTDAFCVVGAAVMIDLILQTTAGTGAVSSPAAALGRSFGLGLAIGLVSGFLWLLFLRLLQMSEHAYPITLSALLLLYVAIDQVGGSAAIGILAFAIVVGNANLIGEKLGFGSTLDLSADVRGFNRQVTFIIKSFFFTFMGAMLGPPWSLVALGVVFGVLLLAARVPAVALALLGSKLPAGERQLVLVSMPRGMAAGVLATMPAAAGVPETTDLPNIVFAAALVSIVIFAVGFPRARRASAAAAAPPLEGGDAAPPPGAAEAPVESAGPGTSAPVPASTGPAAETPSRAAKPQPAVETSQEAAEPQPAAARPATEASPAKSSTEAPEVDPSKEASAAATRPTQAPPAVKPATETDAEASPIDGPGPESDQSPTDPDLERPS